MSCHSSAWLILTMFSRLYLPISICSGNASSILRVAQSYGGPYRSQATTGDQVQRKNLNFHLASLYYGGVHTRFQFSLLHAEALAIVGNFVFEYWTSDILHETFTVVYPGMPCKMRSEAVPGQELGEMQSVSFKSESRPKLLIMKLQSYNGFAEKRLCNFCQFVR
jgi:hypothetical protein